MSEPKTQEEKKDDASMTTNAIYYPARTCDYYLKNDDVYGLGIVANRPMKKGKMAVSDSIEFMFSDVKEGDYLLLDDVQMARRKSDTLVPERIPLTQEMLERTHGVPCLLPDPTGETGGTITWRLEVPGMLMNHSCDPNILTNIADDAKGEDYTNRDVQRGEELTWDYCLQYYDKGPFFEKCLCGSSNCRGKMMGFKDLSDDLKKELYPKASKAVQAMYLADIGKGPPLKFEQVSDFPPRNPSDALRLVFPGPSHALAPLKIEKSDDENSEFRLCANKDFKFGDLVYEFWRKKWPKIGENGPSEIDMVFSSPLLEGDPAEGTTIRVDAKKCAFKDKKGAHLFSGWEMLVPHSCDPNIMYNPNENQADDWHAAYAAKDISKGELLTIDFNSVDWDRTDSGIGNFACNCGSTECAGTTQGYKFLSPEEQEKRRLMTWRRVGPPHDGEASRDTKKVGLALSRYIRECWRAGDEGKDVAMDSSTCESSSSSSSSSSSEDED